MRKRPAPEGAADGTPPEQQIPVLASYQWSPSESDDWWDWHPQEAPAGTVYYQDGEPEGTPDAPTTQTISYSATPSIGGPNVAAYYEITYHDPFEEITSWSYNVTATGPLYGSDPLSNDNTLDIVWGPEAAYSQAVTKGTTSSQGLDLEGGMDASWLKLFDIDFDVTKTSETGSETSGTSTCPFAILKGYYTYPMFTDTYLRTSIRYRQWSSAGEVTVDASGNDAPAIETFDEYGGSSISWHAPLPSSFNIPIQDPDPVPVIPTPPPGS